MKQTAIEWLETHFKYRSNGFNLLEGLFNQAKEIEKQQIIDAGNSCALMQHIHIDKINKMTESEIRQFAKEKHLTFGEKYFNETFKE